LGHCVREDPNATGEPTSLLSVPLPWDEGETVRAAVRVYESLQLAEAGLGHDLARSGQDGRSYAPMAFSGRELAGRLEGGTRGFGWVTINPILSLHFPDIEGHSVALSTEDFAAEIRSAKDPRRRSGQPKTFKEPTSENRPSTRWGGRSNDRAE
jgi:hypothetical protein